MCDFFGYFCAMCQKNPGKASLGDFFFTAGFSTVGCPSFNLQLRSFSLFPVFPHHCCEQVPLIFDHCDVQWLDFPKGFGRVSALVRFNCRILQYWEQDLPKITI